MSKNLIWCFKRTLHFTNSLNVYEHNTITRAIKRNFTKSLGAIGNTIIIPKLPQITKSNGDCEAVSYKEFLKGTQFGKSSAIATLVEIFSLTNDAAKQLVQDYPILKHIPAKSIVDVFNILRKAGIRAEVIAENPYLLTDVDGDLAEKIEILKNIDIDINDIIILFNVNLKILKQYNTNREDDAIHLSQSNRIRYLAEKLNAPITQICRWISFNNLLLTWPITRVKKTVEYFLDSGVLPQDIMSDSVAFKYRFSTIKERMEKVKPLNIQPLKLWVLRRTVSDWESYKEILDQRNFYLHNAEDVLSEMFGCDKEEIKFLKNKMPHLSPDKFLRNAKILHDAGYSIRDLIDSPRTLLRKDTTLKEYLDICKKYDIGKRHLWTFNLTKKKFVKSLLENKYLP